MSENKAWQRGGPGVAFPGDREVVLFMRPEQGEGIYLQFSRPATSADLQAEEGCRHTHLSIDGDTTVNEICLSAEAFLALQSLFGHLPKFESLEDFKKFSASMPYPV
jgi:hypothetical protein